MNIIKDYIDTAYTFFPKDVCCINNRDQYIKTREYNNLLRAIAVVEGKSFTQDLEIFVSEFKKVNSNKKFEDKTWFSWQDRCYAFYLTEQKGNTFYDIRFYKSILIPSYSIDVVKIVFDEKTKQYDHIILDEKDINSILLNEVNIVSRLAEKILSATLFPKELENHIIKDLSFQDIRLGQFTLYNAFFLNRKI